MIFNLITTPAWLLFLYTGLAVRENILRVNGNDIRPLRVQIIWLSQVFYYFRTQSILLLKNPLASFDENPVLFFNFVI